MAQVLSAAMGAKVIKAGKGAKVIKGAGKGSKVIKGSTGGKGGKGRGKQTLKKPASSSEGHVMKRPAAAVDSPEERLKLAEQLQSEQDAKDLADTSGKHVGNTQGEAEGRDPLKAKMFKALYRSGQMDEGIRNAYDEAAAKQGTCSMMRRLYYEKNKEKLKERARLYYEKNNGKRKGYKRQYREKNKGKLNEKCRLHPQSQKDDGREEKRVQSAVS